MSRIQEIEQEILKLAWNDFKNFSGIQAKWGMEILEGWGVKNLITWVGNNEDIDNELREISLPEDKSSARLAVLKNILNVGYIDGGNGYFLGQNHHPVIRLFIEWRDILETELEQKITTLATEVSTHLEALQRGQEWSERQASEIQQKNQTIEQLQTNLTQAQQKYQNHLTQEKAQIQQEIQLIKEVIQ